MDPRHPQRSAFIRVQMVRSAMAWGFGGCLHRLIPGLPDDGGSATLGRSMKIPDEISRLPQFAELVTRLKAPGSGRSGVVFGVEVPLRVCPLGAHVDHQGGVVTGMAIDRSIRMVAAIDDRPVLRVESMNFPGVVEVRLDREPVPAGDGWGDYVRAAVGALRSKYSLDHGLSAVIRGELAGAGLSSSAAVLIALLVGLAEANDIELSRRELAERVQLAENAFIGVSSGLLDQSVMIHAECGALTRIDCRDHSVVQIESPPGTTMPAILVAFTGTARSLADSGYNLRVTECREAARLLLQMGGMEVPSQPQLRDVEPEFFGSQGHRLPPDLRRRATHYFTEMERVSMGAEAWRRGDLSGFGDLVNASGESSMVNYECGTPPLATMVELLRSRDGVYGTRFSGGGFGGTCLALAAREACDEIIVSVSRDYAAAHSGLALNAVYEVCGLAGPMRVFRSGS